MANCFRSVGLLVQSMGIILTMLGTCASLEAFQGAPAPPPAREKSLFEELPVVEAAALHAQTLEEAPASVTVITASDIRKYGYRTLGEALASVRGVYVTSDRIYHYVGVAGFSIPGDYNTRFLVMLNGHPLTDNIYNSNGFFGQDFGLDMDLIERIEFIRGPSSALYGSNGILANINIVTKSPVDMDRFRVSTETGSFGENKVLLSTSQYLGKGANLLVSGSFFDNLGQDLYFPEFDSPQTNFGRSSGADGEKGYHTFANLVWKDWNITAYFNKRQKQPPIAWGNSVFDDSGSRVRDSRNFVGATYTHELASNRELRWQLYYDNYRYDDRFDYAGADGSLIDIRTLNRGDWVGSELTYRLPIPKVGDLTLGTQFDFELRNLQEGIQAAPEYNLLSQINQPDRTYALFAQQEWNLSPRWKAYLGLRFDDSINFGHFISPRVALVYQHSSKMVYKFIYGRPYRNPSTFERYYDDGGYSQMANPALRKETANTFEASAERKLRHNVTLLVDFYQYRIDNLIGAVTLPNNVQQYVNGDEDHSTGIESELSWKMANGFEAAGSFAFDLANDIGANLPNSPRQIGKLRLARAFLRNKLTVSSSTQYLSQRQTMTADLVRPVLLEDLTFGTRGLHPNFDLRFGVRNLLNWHYNDPVYLAIDQMRQDGRSLFIKLIWHTRE
jgi:outer membrane receptor for ferrienterochelin and colicins